MGSPRCARPPRRLLSSSIRADRRRSRSSLCRDLDPARGTHDRRARDTRGAVEVHERRHRHEPAGRGVVEAGDRPVAAGSARERLLLRAQGRRLRFSNPELKKKENAICF